MMRRMTLRAALSASVAIGGCSPVTFPIDLHVELPSDAAGLERTDNVSVVLDPSGISSTIPADGTDFSVALELDPSIAAQTVLVYLAEGMELLAWGRTPRVDLVGAGELAVFVGPPGELAGFAPGSGAGGADVLAAPAPGRGAVVLVQDGDTWFLSEIQLDVAAGSRLDLPDGVAATGPDVALVADVGGGAVRVEWGARASAHRFDPSADTWTELDLLGGDALVGRAGAAWQTTAAADRVLVVGGGTTTDALAVSLLPDEDGSYAVEPVAGITLDAPRAGARASWYLRTDTDDDEGLVLSGGDGSFPVLYLTHPAGAVGPAEPWTGLACVQLDAGDAATAGATLRIACGGGVRQGAPTADALVVHLPPGGAPPTIEELPGLLGTPMSDPRWFADDGAVYAQGDASWTRLLRSTLEVTTTATPGTRASAGASAQLATGAVLLAGGVGTDGAPLDGWWLFTPQPPAS
jgi:hypothetical protein